MVNLSPTASFVYLLAVIRKASPELLAALEGWRSVAEDCGLCCSVQQAL